MKLFNYKIVRYKRFSVLFLSISLFIGSLGIIFQKINQAIASPYEIDPTFLSGGGFPSPLAYVFDSEIQSDGKIVVGGSFSSYDGTSTDRVARLNSNGTLDTSFMPASSSGVVYSLEIQPDGKILVGGTFDHDLIRLNSDGTVDTIFQANLGTSFGPGIIFDIRVQPDGKILVGGDFSSFNGNPVNGIIRLNNDGTIDSSFATNGITIGSSIADIGIQSDGKIILVGTFTEFDGNLINHIVRLQPNGSFDAIFATNVGSAANSELITVAIQNDDKIILGGDAEKKGT